MSGTRARRNKSAGKGWELKVIKLLKERNIHPNAVSTRSESRALDAAGIDIVNKDEFRNGIMCDSIQCKSMVKPVPYPKLLNTIRESGRPGAVVFHSQTAKSTVKTKKDGTTTGGKLFTVRDEFAICYLDDYIDLLACREALKSLRIFINPDVKAAVVEALDRYQVKL